jgi:hypothetical protein
MKSRPSIVVAAVGTATAALALGWPLLAQQNPASGPVARYDMRAGTVSGMGAMGGGMGGAMGMMFGGGRSNNVQHELYLRLGSSQAPTKGNAKADHFMPPSAKLGKSVALVAPTRGEREPDILPEKPKGRLLIFWGCGERAPKGQPVVIDFAKVAAGQMPAGFPSSAVIRDWGPNAQNSRTFARWPAEDGKFVKADSSLPGAHRIASNYAPEISFNLTKDFMAPLSVRTGSLPGGATRTNWTAIPGATGYLVGLFGGKQGPGGNMGDMVMWTSSTGRQFGGGLADWLSPGQVAGLVKNGTVLAPTVTSCAIPAEVNAAAADFKVGTLSAFGPEESFSYPPKPATGPWNLQWTARVRHRSMTSWMVMPGMGAMGAQGAGQQNPDCNRRGGIMGGILGGGGGGC